MNLVGMKYNNETTEYDKARNKKKSVFIFLTLTNEISKLMLIVMIKYNVILKLAFLNIENFNTQHCSFEILLQLSL